MVRELMTSTAASSDPNRQTVQNSEPLQEHTGMKVELNGNRNNMFNYLEIYWAMKCVRQCASCGFVCLKLQM